MTDPLTDPRALNLLAAQPDAVDALGQRCTLLACQAHDTSSGVRGAAGAAQWTGDAADTFRRWATKLPGQLDQMYSAYSAASDAPDTYGINLAELKQRIQTLVGELTSARSALGTAQSAMADAQQTLTQASIQQVIVGGLPGPGAGSQAALTNAQDAADSARGAVNRAQGEVDQVKQQALRLLDEFDAVRGKATHGLISAIQSMPQNEETLPQTKLNKVIDSLGPGIVHAFENLPPDSANVARHRDLKDLAQLGADLGTVAGTIGLAAAIALCPADALGLGPAAAALDATTTGAGYAGLAGTGVKTAADGGQLIEGHGDPYALGIDAVGLAAMGANVPGTSAPADALHAAGAAGVVGRLQAQSGALDALQTQIHSGQSASAAFSSLTPAQQTALGGAAATLRDDPAAGAVLSATVKAELHDAQTEAAKRNALNKALHFGLGTASSVTSQALDPQPVAP